MSNARKVLTVAVLAALASAVAPVAEAQPPIRIGASLSQTGVYAALGQNQLRGYQLCVKHTNDKGGVLGRKLALVVYDDGSDPAISPTIRGVDHEIELSGLLDGHVGGGRLSNIPL